MSIGEVLFVCGFPDVSVAFEQSKFLVLAVVEGWDDSSDPREPQKKAEMDAEFVEKTRKKSRPRGRISAATGCGCVGGVVLDYGKSKVKREEGRKGRRGGSRC